MLLDRSVACESTGWPASPGRVELGCASFSPDCRRAPMACARIRLFARLWGIPYQGVPKPSDHTSSQARLNCLMVFLLSNVRTNTPTSKMSAGIAKKFALSCGHHNDRIGSARQDILLAFYLVSCYNSRPHGASDTSILVCHSLYFSV